jgi:hypothetical protein
MAGLSIGGPLKSYERIASDALMSSPLSAKNGVLADHCLATIGASPVGRLSTTVRTYASLPLGPAVFSLWR